MGADFFDFPENIHHFPLWNALLLIDPLLLLHQLEVARLAFMIGNNDDFALPFIQFQPNQFADLNRSGLKA
jgi:hypothetical protein